MKAQNLVRRVGREAERECLLVYGIASLQHLARELIDGCAMCVSHFVPDYIFDLPQRRSRHNRYRRRVAMHPPQHDARRRPVFAGPRCSPRPICAARPNPPAAVSLLAWDKAFPLSVLSTNSGADISPKMPADGSLLSCSPVKSKRFIPSFSVNCPTPVPAIRAALKRHLPETRHPVNATDAP